MAFVQTELRHLLQILTPRGTFSVVLTQSVGYLYKRGKGKAGFVRMNSATSPNPNPNLNPNPSPNRDPVPNPNPNTDRDPGPNPYPAPNPDPAHTLILTLTLTRTRVGDRCGDERVRVIPRLQILEQTPGAGDSLVWF